MAFLEAVITGFKTMQQDIMYYGKGNVYNKQGRRVSKKDREPQEYEQSKVESQLIRVVGYGEIEMNPQKTGQ